MLGQKIRGHHDIWNHALGFTSQILGIFHPFSQINIHLILHKIGKLCLSPMASLAFIITYIPCNNAYSHAHSLRGIIVIFAVRNIDIFNKGNFLREP